MATAWRGLLISVRIQARVLLSQVEMADPQRQLFWLFVLAIPIASVAWTVTHEEVFREPREWCGPKQVLSTVDRAKTVLPVHLRILLQPLCHGTVRDRG